mgnify:CR=1 FL=1
MGYRVAICDDSREDAAFENALLQEWAKARQIDAEAELFFSAEEFLFHYEENAAYDMLLLDIEMGGMDGVSLAKRLRRDNDTVQIVFITGYSDYIAEGYEVAALHYLMKPLDENKLFSVLDRAAEKLRKNEKVLHLELSGEMVRIPVHRIRWAEVSGNYVTIHETTDHSAKMTLGQLEQALDDRFLRIGRSAIVNLTQIARVTRTEIRLLSGDCIPLPRGAYETVNRAIINLR